MTHTHTHIHTHQGGETPRDKNCQTGAGPVLESSLLVRSSHARYFYDLPDLGTSYYSSPEGGREGGREGGVWGRSQGFQGERKGNQSSPTGYKGEIKEN